MTILLIYIAIYVPFRISFLDEIGSVLTIIEMCADFLFISDIAINFLSAFYDKDNELVTNRKLIAQNYLKTWFAFDFLVCVPFDYIFGDQTTATDYNTLLRLVRIPKLYRLFRVFKLLKISKELQNHQFVEKLLFQMIMNTGKKPTYSFNEFSIIKNDKINNCNAFYCPLLFMYLVLFGKIRKL